MIAFSAEQKKKMDENSPYCMFTTVLFSAQLIYKQTKNNTCRY